jgi:hypothetical protein
LGNFFPKKCKISTFAPLKFRFKEIGEISLLPRSSSTCRSKRLPKIPRGARVIVISVGASHYKSRNYVFAIGAKLSLAFGSKFGAAYILAHTTRASTKKKLDPSGKNVIEFLNFGNFFTPKIPI